MELVKKIRQLDSVIDKLPNDFIGEDGKTRKNIDYSFEGTKNSPFQGLKLSHWRTGTKTFYIAYKQNKKSLRYILGMYKKGQFGIADAQKEVLRLRDKYGNPNNYSWKCNISMVIEIEKINDEEKRAHDLLIQAEKKTINQVAEDWLKSGCPKATKKGKITSSSLKSFLVLLLGNHERRKYIKIQENLNGEAEIIIKHPKADTLEKLFDLYPSEKHSSDKASRSIYDNALGEVRIKDLTRSRLKDYLRIFTPGLQRNITSVISTLWNYALYNEWLGADPKPNPTLKIKIDLPDEVNSKNYIAQYVKQSYTDEQINIIWDLCDKFRDEYPFQTQLIKLILLTGLRFQEASKITEQMLDLRNNQITLFKTITKQRKDRVIRITPMLKTVLDDLYAQKEEDQFSWALFVEWLFPSPRFKKQKLNVKIRSHESRIKGIKQLLNEMSVLCGFKVVCKVLRNTYQTKANDLIEKDWDVIQLTGHADTKTLQDNYLSRKLTKTTIHNADKVSNYYENIIKLPKKIL